MTYNDCSKSKQHKSGFFKVFVSPLIKSVVEKNLFRWLRSVCVIKMRSV